MILELNLKIEDTREELMKLLKDQKAEISLNGTIYDVQINDVIYKDEVSTRGGLFIQDYDQLRIHQTQGRMVAQGYGENKKAKEIAEAKQRVQDTQKAFKEAQRKLSELQGDNK